MYDIVTPTGVVHRPPPGRCWGRIESEYRKLEADGRIHFPKNGDGQPRVKNYESDDVGLVPETFWTAESAGTNDDAKRQLMNMFPGIDAFDTPKPERLLERVIRIATDPGDIVFDAFAGSGTTAAVAHKLGRRWVTTERNEETVALFTKPRLQSVVAGTDASGITDTVGWNGGGGFTVAHLAPSIFEVADGRVYLSKAATNGSFAEGVRAHLGFALLDEPPFCGVKGTLRLAVVDGVADDHVVEVLATRADGQAIMVIAKAVTETAAGTLADLAPGSVIRKAPNGLIQRRVRGTSA